VQTLIGIRDSAQTAIDAIELQASSDLQENFQPIIKEIYDKQWLFECWKSLSNNGSILSQAYQYLYYRAETTSDYHLRSKLINFSESLQAVEGEEKLYIHPRLEYYRIIIGQDGILKSDGEVANHLYYKLFDAINGTIEYFYGLQEKDVENYFYNLRQYYADRTGRR